MLIIDWLTQYLSSDPSRPVTHEPSALCEAVFPDMPYNPHSLWSGGGICLGGVHGLFS
jgi:hypothetical protein